MKQLRAVYSDVSVIWALVCPLDSLAINPDNGKAYMHVDECWYCGPCAARCPTGAVTVNMPYLIR